MEGTLDFCVCVCFDVQKEICFHRQSYQVGINTSTLNMNNTEDDHKYTIHKDSNIILQRGTDVTCRESISQSE